jgi:hypothetical protein
MITPKFEKEFKENTGEYPVVIPDEPYTVYSEVNPRYVEWLESMVNLEKMPPKREPEPEKKKEKEKSSVVIDI